MIPSPYFLYLGHSNDEIGIKTSRGLAVFRREDCVGEFRHDDCGLTLGLPHMSFAEAVAAGARTLVLGIANAGGRLGEDLVRDALAALDAGLNIASGLHQRLRDEPRLAAAAKAKGLTLFDVRDPAPDLPVGSGARRVGRRLLTIGTDCSVGKMYTTLLLARALQARGVPADFRATGQTGILIAGGGIAVDAVVGDFISGAAEMLSPGNDPDHWDVIEGQGAILHPAYAPVTLGLLYGSQPDALVLCDDPLREKLNDFPHVRCPTVSEAMNAYLPLARAANPAARFVGISLNTSAMPESEAFETLRRTAEETGLVCFDPMRTGVDAIVDVLADFPRTEIAEGKELKIQ